MLSKSQVKYIQSLSQKKLRDEEGVFIAEGPKIINELLDAGNVQVQHLFALDDWLQQHPELPAGTFTPVTEKELQRLSFLQTPHQVTGIFKKPVFPVKPVFTGKLTLLLDTIQDPGNMGTIIRCADWFGIEKVVCSENCADVFNPKVIQATMGSVSRVQVIYNEPEALLAQQPGIPVYAAVLEGTPLNELQAVKEGFLLIGNESRGIRSSLLDRCNQRITIPRKGKAESLNAAVAAGIILSHITS